MSGERDQDARERFRALRRAAFESRGFSAIERTVVDARGRATAVLEHGDGDPAVLLHGGVGVTAEWAPLAGRLSGRILIPDRPGFGLSDPRKLRRGGFRSDAADWLAGLLDRLGVERADVVGASMGGFVAIAFATAHPDRVRRLVLTGAAGGLFDDPGLFLRLWGTPVVGAVLSHLMPRDADAVRQRMFGGYLAHPEELPGDLVDVALAATRIPGWTRANRDILRQVTTLRGWRAELRLDDDLVASGCAVGFVIGEHDALMPPSAAHRLASRMPHATVHTIADAGHIPHLDHPAAVAAAVEASRR